jgi:hypothetical protein
MASPRPLSYRQVQRSQLLYRLRLLSTRLSGEMLREYHFADMILAYLLGSIVTAIALFIYLRFG